MTCPSLLRLRSSRRLAVLHEYCQKYTKSMTSHIRKSHPTLMHAASKRSQNPTALTVRLQDFSASVCQPQTPFPACQGLLLTYDRAQWAHHARSWLCHTSVTAFHTWKVHRNFDMLARQKISRPHKHSNSREDIHFQGHKPQDMLPMPQGYLYKLAQPVKLDMTIAWPMNSLRLSDLLQEFSLVGESVMAACMYHAYPSTCAFHMPTRSCLQLLEKTSLSCT